MIAIVPITPANVQLFKDVRLRALADTPSAFGSTYAREAAFPDSEWLTRALRWNGERGIGLLAMDGAVSCGIAGSLLREEDPAKAQLVSMWTAPTHRQQGVGRLLVDEIFNWARSRNVRELLLMVTSVNHPAMAFYDRLGFTRTGLTEPYPHDPALLEYEMSRPVGTAF
jgi:ribosomal protein S18 acetylase RimI-like enzyme